MKNLYILRHAKTNQLSKTGRDYDRELLPKGIAQIQLLKDFLNSCDVNESTQIAVSAAKRTRQTYAGLKDNFTQNTVSFHEELYLASKNELLQFIWKTTSTNDLFLIGHNEGISELTSYFLDENVELGTAAFVHLQFDCDSWAEASRGLATLKNQFHPKP